MFLCPLRYRLRRLVNGGPIGGLPRPDMLICCNNICGTVLRWYEVQAWYFQIPLFILDTPFRHVDFSAWCGFIISGFDALQWRRP